MARGVHGTPVAVQRSVSGASLDQTLRVSQPWAASLVSDTRREIERLKAVVAETDLLLAHSRALQVGRGRWATNQQQQGPLSNA